MSIIDWAIVFAFLVFLVCMGAVLARRASGSMSDFFVSGRSLPWYLAGTSIMATSFSCDTPLHVTKVIREQGLSGAWFYWTALLFAPMIPFLFSRLWRRALVITDCEFVELRYSGRSAALQRFLMALFRLFCIEAITLGWVILGMSKIAHVMLGISPELSIGGVLVSSDVVIVVTLVTTAVIYTALAGLWGVVTNDFIQFIVALFGSILLAIIAVDKVGGIEALKDALSDTGIIGGNALSFLPPTERKGGLSFGAFLVYLFILGWSHAEADGGGNKAQRFLACKSEGHALASSVWDVTIQNIVRNWPWYITALASLVLYREVLDHEMVYPRMIIDLMPAGLRGLMVASLFAAFLSTIDSHLNLSASYFTNDIYKRFLCKGKSESHYVMVSRLAIISMAAIVTFVALNLESVLEALKLKGELMAGLGPVLILRWFWPRITPWSEIASMATSVLTAILLRTTGVGVIEVGNLLGIEPSGDLFPARLLIIVAVSTIVMVIVTFISPPSNPVTIKRFFDRVRPPTWKTKESASLPRESLRAQIANWLLAAMFISSSTFFVGKAILGAKTHALVLFLVALVSGIALFKRIKPLVSS